MVVIQPGSFPPITLAPILAKKGFKLPVVHPAATWNIARSESAAHSKNREKA
jgi:hypothetical protein